MADILEDFKKDGIYKKILYPGEGEVKLYEDGCKLYFHYKTTKADEEKTVIDDSRKDGKPMELILGKKFKLEIWERCLRTMLQKEVAEFLCERKHTATYPLVSKSLRSIRDPHHNHKHEPEKKHCCGMMSLADQGTGHSDLDELIKDPQPLIFTLELVKVEHAGEYEKETWIMTEEERIASLPRLKDEGNELYKQKKYTDAAQKYFTALGILENLVLKEKPGTQEWEDLEDQKIVYLLNYSQCKLIEGDFYPVIQHTTTVLDRHPDNVKALFRRAKAHVGAWNPEDARKDFLKAKELDSSLTKSVTKELAALDKLLKIKEAEEKSKLKGMFES
ncbi:hypothetical protein LOTGIDRAFT_206265 [Lottia gigantea]|uniref:AIP/AIPL N-terminal FKBP-type PPIase domain-containing protein n=1 Tax=Lottia gigantea TaxID=225164 RepID=V4C6T4_LOTGI|nr:hypothetical protein LOTGIDRAFT_206265 [Lottia gigantea]ESO97344.1 hypothetical protein LOTGIDRAFT_206265 [Lottia gigantea]